MISEGSYYINRCVCNHQANTIMTSGKKKGGGGGGEGVDNMMNLSQIQIF